MLIMDLIKVLKEEEPVVFQYEDSFLFFKIVNKHYQIARCMCAINDKVDYMKYHPFYRRVRDEIETLEISTDSDGHIPYLLVKIKT